MLHFQNTFHSSSLTALAYNSDYTFKVQSIMGGRVQVKAFAAERYLKVGTNVGIPP